jgi:hypothetical protein
LAQLNITGKKLEETFNINYIHKMWTSFSTF